MKIFFSSLLLLCVISLAVRGQQYTNGQPLTGQNIADAYYHEQEIVLKPNFSAIAGFSALIKPLPNNYMLELSRPSVISQRVRRPNITNLATVNASSSPTVTRTYDFQDAFGRTMQTVVKDYHTLGSDLVHPYTFEMSASKQKSYLPYTAAYNGDSYRVDAIRGDGGYDNSGQRQYYLNPPEGVATAGSNGKAFAEIRTEDFGGRPLEQAAAGVHHLLGSGHTVTNTYTFNSGELRKWEMATTGLSTPGYYDPNINGIRKTVTTDGDGQVSMVYNDLEGRLLASVKMLNGNALTTYYVYDVFDRLAYVVPPLPVELGTPSAIADTDEVFKNFVYAYKYDKHGRVIEKHVPAQGWSSVVYNKRNQMVLTQSAVQQVQQKWSFVKYDGAGRPAYSGIYSTTADRETLQTLANTYSGALYESATPAMGMGYSNTSFPIINSTTGSETYAYNYYDSYGVLANVNINQQTNSSIFKLPTADTLLKAPAGLVTVSLKKVVGTTDYLMSVMYYDQESRLVQLTAQNYYANKKHINNYDLANTVFNFEGTVHQTTSIQSVDAATPLLTKLETFNQYDHQDRLLEVSQRINNGSTMVIERYSYNALGQLARKKVHSTDGEHFLQNFNYRYDIGGQLIMLNNPKNLIDEDDASKTDVFAFKLYREDVGTTGSTPRYNGNIAAVSWQTKVPSLLTGTITQDEKTFAYTYDQLGRLIDAQYKTATISNSFREQLNYDVLGNITSLIRKDKQGGILNQLNYNYGSTIRKQQLADVSDVGSEAYTSSYTYDATGRLKSDTYTQATNIAYNDLDRISAVSLSGSHQISYLYDAAGNKLYREASGTSGVDKQYYVNGSEYDTNGNLLFIRTFFGRLVPNGSGSFTYEYFIRDHLGNIRSIYADRNGNLQVDANEISDVTDYYPFGKPLNYGFSYAATPLNSYGFGEKEQQPWTAYLDFANRQYDANIGRWLSVDPLAELFFNWGGYNYVLGDPINMVDNDGRYAVSVHYSITYKTLLSLGYSKKEADLFAHYSSTYADHPPAKAIFFDSTLHPLETNDHNYRKGIDYSKTAESQLEKNSRWHSMMSDAEAEAGMTERQALFRGLKFGWDNVFASKGSNLEKYGQGIHALQDAVAHRGARTNHHLGVNTVSVAMFYNDLYGSTKDAEALTRSAAVVAGLMAGRNVKFEKDEIMNFQGMSGDQLESAIKLLLNKGYTGTIYFEQQ
ncbi:RHS repeat domain-containing protein [Pedobacter sp.]